MTGISYGGIQSLSLGRLRDRIRLENGTYRPWRSPAGKAVRIAAAYPRWGGSDMTYALRRTAATSTSSPTGSVRHRARWRDEEATTTAST